MMERRRLGRLGFDVPVVTFGTDGLARADPDGERLAALARALDVGMNAFEVDAGSSGAVRRLGDVLRPYAGRNDAQVFVRATSRVPFDLPSPHVPVQQAYPGEALRAQTESLLQTLGVERLAVLQLHAFCPEWLHEGDWLETLQRLRSEGKIAGVGISLFDHDLDAGVAAIGSGAVDAVQLMYNLFDPAAAALFPLCANAEVGVLARSPLYFGALARPSWLEDERHGPGDWRTAYFYGAHRDETRRRVARLGAEIGDGPLLTDVAIRFGLSDPRVSTVVLGLSSPSQVDAALRAASEGSLEAALVARLAPHRWLC